MAGHMRGAPRPALPPCRPFQPRRRRSAAALAHWCEAVARLWRSLAQAKLGPGEARPRAGPAPPPKASGSCGGGGSSSAAGAARRARTTAKEKGKEKKQKKATCRARFCVWWRSACGRRAQTTSPVFGAPSEKRAARSLPASLGGAPRHGSRSADRHADPQRAPAPQAARAGWSASGYSSEDSSEAHCIAERRWMQTAALGGVAVPFFCRIVLGRSVRRHAVATRFCNHLDLYETDI